MHTIRVLPSCKESAWPLQLRDKLLESVSGRVELVETVRIEQSDNVLDNRMYQRGRMRLGYVLKRWRDDKPIDSILQHAQACQAVISSICERQAP